MVQTVPGPRGPRAAFSAIQAFVSPKAAATHYGEMVQQYGKIVGIHLPFGKKIYYVADAGAHDTISRDHRSFPRSSLQQSFAPLVGQVLGGEGPEQHRRRQLMNPSLSRKAIMSYVGVMQQTLNERFPALDAAMYTDNFDLLEFLLSVMSTNMARMLAGGAKMPDGLGLRIVEVVEKYQKTMFGLLPGYKKLKRQIDADITELINRCADGNDYGYLTIIYKEIKEDRMSLADGIAEVIGFFNASAETTANTVAWTLYFLVQNPEHYAALRAEAQRVFNGRDEITAEEVRGLEFALRCFKEGARLRPQAWRQLRQVANERQTIKVGGVTYHLEKGAQVFNLVNLIQTSSEAWGHQAETFNPANMEPEFLKAQVREYPGCYGPWSFGIHMCPGQPLAEVEGMLTLAMIANRYSYIDMQRNVAPVHGPVLAFPHGVQAYFAR